jgi:hypothetical protein
MTSGSQLCAEIAYPVYCSLGQRLTAATAPSLDPRMGKMTVRTLEWGRSSRSINRVTVSTPLVVVARRARRLRRECRSISPEGMTISSTVWLPLPRSLTAAALPW